MEKDYITFFPEGFRNSLQAFSLYKKYVHQCIIMVKILSHSAIACTESVYWKRCKKKCRLVKRSLNHGVPFAQHRSCSDSAGLRSEQQYHFFRHRCRCQGVARRMWLGSLCGTSMDWNKRRYRFQVFFVVSTSGYFESNPVCNRPCT